MVSEAPLIPWLEHLRQLYPPQGVVVVGAGNGTGPWIQALRRWNTEHVTLVEADDGQFQHLQRSSANHEHWLLRKQVVAHASQSVAFHLASNPAENGLLEPEHLRTLWPNLETREKQTRAAITLAELLQGVTPQPNWLWLDCLPAAGLLQGAGKTLDGINVVLVRGLQSGTDVLAEEDAASSIPAVTRQLQTRGFVWVATESDRHPGIAHALYVRDYAAQSAKASADHTLEVEAVQAELSQVEQRAEHTAMALATARAEAEQARMAAGQADEKLRLIEAHVHKLEAQAVQISAKHARDAQAQSQILVALQQTEATLKESMTSLQANLAQRTEALAPDRAALHAGFTTLENLITQQHSSLQDLTQQLRQTDPLVPVAAALETQLAKLRAYSRQDLKEAETRLRTEMNQGLANAVKQIEAFLSIQDYIRSGDSPTDFHGWPISPDLGLFLLEKLREQRYDLIVEFGSGTSTALLAKGVEVLSRMPPPADGTPAASTTEIVSFEHDPTYHTKTHKILQARGLAHYVQLIHAPLVNWYEGEQHYLYYDCAATLAALAARYAQKKARILLFVDGPPGATGPKARYPAVPLVFNALSEHQIDVVLDDARRSDEKSIIDLWRKHWERKGINVAQVSVPSEKGLYFASTYL